MAQCLFRSFPNNVTRVAISSYKNVDYDVKPAKMRFTSHENLLVHPLLLPVSSQREQTIAINVSWHGTIQPIIDEKSGVANSQLKSNGSGQHTITPSCCSMIHISSTSSTAFPTFSTGNGLPGFFEYKSHHIGFKQALTLAVNRGKHAPSARPTMISSNGSHSLCEHTGETMEFPVELLRES